MRFPLRVMRFSIRRGQLLITRDEILINSNGAAIRVNESLFRVNENPINSDGIFIKLNEKFIRVDGFVIKRGQNPGESGDERSRRNETGIRFLHDVFEKGAHMREVVVIQAVRAGAATTLRPLTHAAR
jgi:hypothetical protein